jgi:hypothetical protein
VRVIIVRKEGRDWAGSGEPMKPLQSAFRFRESANRKQSGLHGSYPCTWMTGKPRQSSDTTL